MTLRRVEPGQARLLALAVEYDFPKRTADWLDRLAQGELTEEMQNVFEAFGYLEKRTRRQSRPKVGTIPPSEKDLDEMIDETLTREDRDNGSAPEPQPDVVRFAHGDEDAADYEAPRLDLRG